MVDKKHVILLILVVIITIIPLVMYNGLGENEGYFKGADSAANAAIEEIGYKPWFNSIWEPLSGEMQSLLFALQAAIGAIIIGFVFGYYKGQASERKRMAKKRDEIAKSK